MNLQADYENFRRWRASQAAANPEARIPIAEVLALCGGISRMTLHRWLNNPDLNFLVPIRIQNRRYWLRSEIVAWLESRGES